jgi:hypothetical protein
LFFFFSKFACAEHQVRTILFNWVRFYETSPCWDLARGLFFWSSWLWTELTFLAILHRVNFTMLMNIFLGPRHITY